MPIEVIALLITSGLAVLMVLWVPALQVMARLVKARPHANAHQASLQQDRR